jgi:hypothetical protein
MTRSSFRYRLFAISIFALAILVAAAVAKITGYEKAYQFVKDMAAYILLAVSPYIGYVFQRRAKFLELLQGEWRRINAVKQDIISYCQKGKSDLEKYVEVYSKMSAAIDDMRVIFRNVGESREYIGLYPYETLHDFRRHLDKIDPRRGTVTPQAMNDVSRATVSSFLAFRDIFLIELDPIEPDFPIVVRGMVRSRSEGIDPKLSDGVARKRRKMESFGQGQTATGDERP